MQPQVLCDSPDFKRGQPYEVSRDELQKLLDTHEHLPEIYNKMKGKSTFSYYLQCTGTDVVCNFSSIYDRQAIRCWLYSQVIEIAYELFSLIY